MDTPSNGSSRLSPESVQQAERPTQLQIDGLVANPQRLAPQDLVALPRITLVEAIPCDHRAGEKNPVWRGVSLRQVLQLAQPQSEAHYVCVYADNYTVPLALAEIEGLCWSKASMVSPCLPNGARRGGFWCRGRIAMLM